MNKVIKSALGIGIGMLPSIGVYAQTTPMDNVAPGPHIRFEIHNLQLIGSGTATPSMTYDLYMSSSTTYFNYVAANGTSNGLQNVDVGFDVDFGTDGTTTVSNPPAPGGNANFSVLPVNVSNGILSSVSGTSNLAPSTNPAGYECKYKFNLVRLDPASLAIPTTPTKVVTATILLPAGTVFGTITPGGATIRIRTSALNTGVLTQSTNPFGTGLAGSKWGDFNGNGANIVGPSANATGIQPLPVQLLDFSATRASDGLRSQLSWTTATETNSDYFEVERSATGEQASFSAIGVRVKGAGTSTGKLTYQTYDRAPIVGMNYYRLRIMDLSGKWGYSDIKSVRFDGGKLNSESVSFYPNPLTGLNSGAAGVRVTASGAQTLSYTISDASGKLVSGGSLEVMKGTDSYGIEGFESLSAGTYYLTAKGATINATLKISKTN